MPKERVNMVLVYEKEDDFRIGLESYYFSQQKLKNGSRSSDYWIFGLMTEKYFSDDFSLFINFENFSDTRQTRDGPIYSGSISNPQFVDIYAPLDGFVINGGIKLRDTTSFGLPGHWRLGVLPPEAQAALGTALRRAEVFE